MMMFEYIRKQGRYSDDKNFEKQKVKIAEILGKKIRFSSFLLLYFPNSSVFFPTYCLKNETYCEQNFWLHSALFHRFPYFAMPPSQGFQKKNPLLKKGCGQGMYF